MSLPKHIPLSYLAALCSLLCALLLVGCSIGGTSTPSPTTLFGNPKLDSSPKGPGGITVTTGPLTGCVISNISPAATGGWKSYRDGRFPFQFAVPPGWRVGSFTDDSGNDYIVELFPPDSTTPIGQAGIIDPEHFAISLALAGSSSTYAGDPNWKAEKNSLTINHVKTPLYDRASPDCAALSRAATADFAHHHFTFYMVSTPEKEKNDSALFLGLLQTFAYRE